MKKQFLSLGKALSKREQQNINGGYVTCSTIDCPSCSKCVPAEPYPYCEPDPTQMCHKDPQ